ncbi:hypothetical protein SVAN01_04204 [Stagonosporopsis vannaccii]|nr:hypothetical protein SVAN01_04204 [Stagonosporopsis vannaccii]
MTIPSFARATQSSILKKNLRGDKSRGTAPSNKQQSPAPSLESPKPVRKLKRPSRLTQRARKSIAYNADLTHIRPSNPSKPCPLAELPSELRILIYSYIFGDCRRPILMYYGRLKYSPPVLLQICRAIRIEAAYNYFSGASFTWTIKNLNFAMVMKWLNRLQPSHRALLSRNPNLTIDIFPGLLKSYTYPPEGFLLDDTMESHWKTCQPFGNLYTIGATEGNLATTNNPALDRSQAKVRLFFILFCRLATWSKMRTHPNFANISWKYTFDFPSGANETWSLYRSMLRLLSKIEFLLPQLKDCWTRDQCEARIRRPILELVDVFINNLTEFIGADEGRRSLSSRLRACRDRIDKWDRSNPC